MRRIWWLVAGLAALAAGVVVRASLQKEEMRPAPEPPPPIAAAEPDAAPPPPPPTLDLGGARALVPDLSGWEKLAPGVYARSAAGGGPYLTDTLLLDATCLDDCAKIDATMARLDRWWLDARPAYRMRWTPRPGKVQQPSPDVRTVVVEMASDAPETDARAYVQVIHPRGAAKALLCELVVFGDAAALERVAQVCRDLKIVTP
jgi:hypothetical protein